MVVVSSGTMLSPVRREFQRSMGNTVALVRDQTAPNKAVTHSIDELKVSIMSDVNNVGICILLNKYTASN